MTANDERARVILAAALEIDLAAVGPDASIATLEAWDSLAHLRLVQAIEQAIGGELPAEAIVEIASLTDVTVALTRAGR